MRLKSGRNIYRVVHVRRIGRKKGMSKLEVDVAYRDGKPYFYFKITDFRMSTVVIRLSGNEVLALISSLLTGFMNEEKNSKRAGRDTGSDEEISTDVEAL